MSDGCKVAVGAGLCGQPAVGTLTGTFDTTSYEVPVCEWHLEIVSRGVTDHLWPSGPTTAPGSIFPSIAAFYADRPERERSPETDYGVMWWDGGASWPRYRVSWIRATGEFYAINLAHVHHPEGGRVELLGVIEGEEAAEKALEGWADLKYSELNWVRERLA